MTRIVAALMLAWLSGCAAPVPKRVESLNIPPAVPDLSLVIVPTENTRNAVEFNRVHNRGHIGAEFFNPMAEAINQLNKEQPINTLVATLNANFKSVIKVDSLNQAKTAGADLIGMLDYFQEYPIKFKFGPGLTGHLRIDETLLLLDPAGNEVARIAASAIKEVEKENEELTSLTSMFKHFGVPPLEIMYVELQDDLMAKFEAALTGSEPLRRYAERRPSAVAAAAPAAEPRALRSDVDEPAYKIKEDGAKFAVVVGVEDYQSLGRAEFADHDAKAVRAHLRALGYPDRNVVLLTGQEAGKSGLEKYLESWLPRNVDDRSQVFVYFAGHGAPDVKSGQAYLMPWDADPNFLDATAYPVRRLYDQMAALKAKRVVIAFDAAFSGAGGRSVIAKGARPLVTRVEEVGPRSDRVVVLSAASGDEVTSADKTQGHGVFTYFLLKGLNDRGGTASVRSLYDYLKPKVQDAARRDQRDQTPRLLPASGSTDEEL